MTQYIMPHAEGYAPFMAARGFQGGGDREMTATANQSAMLHAVCHVDGDRCWETSLEKHKDCAAVAAHPGCVWSIDR